MPGSQVKDWDLYHKLRSEGHDEESAARIANAAAKKRKRNKLKKALGASYPEISPIGQPISRVDLRRLRDAR